MDVVVSDRRLWSSSLLPSVVNGHRRSCSPSVSVIVVCRRRFRHRRHRSTPSSSVVAFVAVFVAHRRHCRRWPLSSSWTSLSVVVVVGHHCCCRRSSTVIVGRVIRRLGVRCRSTSLSSSSSSVVAVVVCRCLRRHLVFVIVGRCRRGVVGVGRRRCHHSCRPSYSSSSSSVAHVRIRRAGYCYCSFCWLATYREPISPR